MSAHIEGGLIEDEWETLHFPLQDQIWYEPSLTVHFLVANSQAGSNRNLFFCITFN